MTQTPTLPNNPTSATRATARPDFGATPHAQGVTFRVWAPHADAVSLKGTFNGWSDTADMLAAEPDGVWAIDVAAAKPGDEYRFVIRTGDRALERIDPRARQVTNSTGNAVVYDAAGFEWGDDAFVMPPHNQLVIYEMHIGSFFVEKAGQPGTFELAEDKLAHIARLGANAVQIMPVAEFAGDYSWGYNPAHIFAVESAYGGPDALKAFVRAAHRLGIAVILDVVYNHFGPSDLHLWQFDGWSENAKGGIYFYNDDRADTPWGATRPDYGRGEVRTFIHDNAMMWLTEFRIDGLRFDSTLFMRSIHGGGGDDIADGWSLLQWITDSVRARFPEKITIAEDLRNNVWLTKSTGEGGAGFHTQWDANFVHPVRATMITPDDQARSMDAIRDAILAIPDGDAFRRVVYSESHDEVANGKARVPQEVDPQDSTGWFARKRSTLAAALVFTAPGIPMLFQGQEFLEGEWFRDDVPLDWDRNDAFRGIVRLYRDLIRLRTNAEGDTRGLTGQGITILHVNDAENMLAFCRWSEAGSGDDVVVVINGSNRAWEAYDIGVPAAGPWRLRLNSDARVYSRDFQGELGSDVEAVSEARDGQPAKITLAIAPYSVLVYTRGG